MHRFSFVAVLAVLLLVACSADARYLDPSIPNGGGACSTNADCNYNNGSCVAGKCVCGNDMIAGLWCQCRPTQTDGVCRMLPKMYLVHNVCVAADVCVATTQAERASVLTGAQLVSQWNDAAMKSIKANQMPPPDAARMLAIMHLAMHDAIQNIPDGRYKKYKYAAASASNTSREAAAAQAAHDVLCSFFASRKTVLDALLAQHLATIANGAPKTQGITLGSTIASMILADRATDGVSNPPPPYVVNPALGYYKLTPPFFDQPVAQQYPTLRPFTMLTQGMFRITPTSPLYSDYVKSTTPFNPTSFVSTAAYATAFQEVKDYGGATSAKRTADQAQTALFWRVDPIGDAKVITPPGLHNTQTQQFVLAHNRDLQDAARIFAMLNMSLADAAIMCWDMKVNLNFWRPITGIPNADIDNNPSTTKDASWSSYITTPPHQSTPSGHSTFAGTGATVLAAFFDEQTPWRQEADEFPGMWRRWGSLWEAAAEDGQSRIFGGVHWQFDNLLGLSSGRLLAKYIINNYLKPNA